METARNNSEVARLRQQIEAEYQAAQRAISDVRMVGRHSFITMRQENIGQCFQTLSTLMKPEEAIKVVAETLQQASEEPGPQAR